MASLSSVIAQNIEDTPSKLVDLQLFLDNINSGSGLGGTNYVFVRGDGTPYENFAELQEAYNLAKTMPRYLGILSPTEPLLSYYAGQTFRDEDTGQFRYVNESFTGALYDGDNLSKTSVTSYLVAMENRVTVVVAPGKYYAPEEAFKVDSTSIDIVSLTGSPDVILTSGEIETEFGREIGINVLTDNVYLRGIKTLNTFYIATNPLALESVIIEKCVGADGSFGYNKENDLFIETEGGDNSFGGDGGFYATAIRCKGGDSSFGFDELGGTCDSCTGGNGSFGGGDAILGTGRLYNCRLTDGIYTNINVGAKLVGCIDGTGKIINADSQLSYRVYSGLFTQSGTSAPTVTVIENTLGVTPVWQRTDAGDYSCTIPLAGTIICLQDGNIFRSNGTEDQALILGFGTPGVSGGLGIMTKDLSNTTIDGVLFNTFIEFRVYN